MIYLSEPDRITDDWRLVALFVGDGSLSVPVMQRGDTTDTVVVPDGMTADDAWEQNGLRVPLIVALTDDQFVTDRQAIDRRLAAQFGWTVAGGPRTAAVSPHLEERGLWNDPGSGRFVRRGWSSLKWLLSLSNRDQRLWEKARRLNDDDKVGVEVLLRNPRPRLGLGVDDGLRVVEVYDAGTDREGTVLVRNPVDGRTFLVAWADLADVRPVADTVDERRSIDLMALPPPDASAGDRPVDRPFTYMDRPVRFSEVDAADITTTRVLAAYIEVGDRSFTVGYVTWDRKNKTVELVGVQRDARNAGVATELIRQALQLEPELRPKANDQRSAGGEALIQKFWPGTPPAGRRFTEREAEAQASRMLFALDVSPDKRMDIAPDEQQLDDAVVEARRRFMDERVKASEEASDQAIDLLRRGTVTAPDGAHPATPEDRERLKIPPGWVDVFVADDPTNYRQVWARDAQGRSQGRYTAEYEARQEALKFERVKELATKLDDLDNALVRDMMTDPAAAVTALIRHFGLRPGSMKDTRARKQAYGATTLQARHVRQYPDTGRTTLSFVGKSGQKITVSTRDPDIYRLMQHWTDGKQGTDFLFEATDADVRAYLTGAIGPGFLAKDLRTLKANVMALEMVRSMRRPTTMTAFRKARNKVADAVAKALGNTRAVTLSGYINPTVFADWEDRLL